jgi:hypothetical protein
MNLLRALEKSLKRNLRRRYLTITRCHSPLSVSKFVPETKAEAFVENYHRS